jgi:hypothetical protein
VESCDCWVGVLVCAEEKESGFLWERLSRYNPPNKLDDSNHCYRDPDALDAGVKVEWTLSVQDRPTARNGVGVADHYLVRDSETS